MPKFATYLHEHVCSTSKPIEQIQFVGQSYPYFCQVRTELAKALSEYPVLKVREANLEDFLRVHSDAYVNQLKMMARGEPVKETKNLSIECVGLEYCLPGYMYGLGGMLEAIDQMRVGELDRAYCICLGGHHAYANWGHGYCLLNPQAAAVRYAQSKGFKKILVIDWDLHHGDGTQSIFANDPSVYCISIHSAFDLYMAVMRVIKDGTTTAGEQVGHCNIPLLLEKYYKDEIVDKLGLTGKLYKASDSLSAFRSAVEQAPWSPDLISIFSGYDSHKDDHGKGITDWSDREYELLTENVLRLSQKVSCPVLSVHGGGYKLEVTISAATSHVAVLANHL
jgi:acetoin utilization deacetylase AcuC-like enzyme